MQILDKILKLLTYHKVTNSQVFWPTLYFKT